MPAFFMLAACATGGGGGVGAGEPLTRAERSNYLETSTHADVMAFLDSLKGRPELAFGSIGTTNEGREIPYVIASRPRVSTPAEARLLGRPVIYVQGNIHAGEVEGKEALQALLRDLTRPGARNVLDAVVLIAVPIYNADGNERFAPQEVNRGSQNGPAMVGVRANAQGLDLNRDYMKAEAPETRASLAMFNEWDPDVFVDLHATNGSYHGYALTYAGPLNPAAALNVHVRDSVIPAIAARMRERHGYATFDYGNFISQDTVAKGWATFDSRPRFGTNYIGLRGRIGILSEAYSHDPFERRVRSTYAFVTEILSWFAEHPPAPRPVRALPDVPVRSEMAAAPEQIAVVVEAVENTGDTLRTEPGMPRGRRRTGRFQEVRMPVYDRFTPTLTVPMPERYFLRPGDTAAVRVLRAHGIEVQETSDYSGGHRTAERGDQRFEMVATGYSFVVDSAIAAERAFQGHREMRVTGRWRGETKTIPGGSFFVETSQPLGLLAVYLLEPQSDDGLVTWNFFDRDLVPGATYPVFRVGGRPPSQ